MGERFIRLTATGGRISVKSYVAGIQAAKANPDAKFKHGLTCWWPCSGRQVVAQYREGLQERINEAVPWLVRGTAPATPVRIAPTSTVYEHGAPVSSGRMHRNQAQWRRRLTGKRHLFMSWSGDEDEPTYLCQRCERKHGLPWSTTEATGYQGPGGHIPLQHVGRDPQGNALIPWCDHPKHGGGRLAAAA